MNSSKKLGHEQLEILTLKETSLRVFGKYIRETLDKAFYTIKR